MKNAASSAAAEPPASRLPLRMAGSLAKAG
jgi:hypothetical protein